jgi:acyl-CoA thioesterase
MASYSDIVGQVDWDSVPALATISDDWCQGRTVFGGLTTGLALRALLTQVDPERPLRSVLASFVGPVQVGDVAITTQILREGQNVTHAQANIVQEDACCCTILACFGKDRDSAVRHDASPMPAMADPEALIRAPFVPGITPEFTRNVDYRWTSESMPYLGNGTGTSDGWIRMLDECAISPDLLMLLVDAWPSPALAMLQGPAPVSSLTWGLEIFHLNPQHRASDWWRIHSCIESAAEGYVYEDALIWAADGAPVARSRQTVSVYLPNRERK